MESPHSKVRSSLGSAAIGWVRVPDLVWGLAIMRVLFFWRFFMETLHKQYYKAALVVLLLVLISFCINSIVLNPFEHSPYVFRILYIVTAALSVFAFFKSRKLLVQLDLVSIVKYLFSFFVAIVFFSGIMTIFNPQITQLIVAKKYDDYSVQIKEEDRYQPLYYYFAVAQQKNNVKYLLNFEKNDLIENFIYLDDNGLEALTNIMKVSKDKNFIELYDRFNKDGKISKKEAKQILLYLATFGVTYEKQPF